MRHHRTRRHHITRDTSPMSLLEDLENSGPLPTAISSTTSVFDAASEALTEIGSAVQSRMAMQISGQQLATGLRRLSTTETEKGSAAIRVIYEQVKETVYAKYVAPLLDTFTVATLDVAVIAIDLEVDNIERSIHALVPARNAMPEIVRADTIDDLVNQFADEVRPSIRSALSLAKTMNLGKDLSSSLAEACEGLAQLDESIKSVNRDESYLIDDKLANAIEKAVRS